MVKGRCLWKGLMIPTHIGDVRVLIHKSSKEKAPVYFNLHGGGFVRGKAEFDDDLCEDIKKKLDINVVNIDYPLAPEYKFPTNDEAVYDIVSYMVKNCDEFNIDVNKMTIGGHSSGGNIAAAVSIMAKDRKEFSFVAQILDYPPLDLFTSPWDKFYTEGAIPRETAKFFDECYCDEAQLKNPLCSPIYSTIEELMGLPDALVITCEIDSLRDEAEEYAKMLMQAGVEVTGKRFYGANHGVTKRDSELGEQARQMIIDYIGRKVL